MENGIFLYVKNTNKLMKKHKVILIIALCVFIASILIPPWDYVFDRAYHAHTRNPAGYHFLFSPPQKQVDSPLYGVDVSQGRLFIEWLCIAALTGISALLKPSKRPKVEINAPHIDSANN